MSTMSENRDYSSSILILIDTPAIGRPFPVAESANARRSAGRLTRTDGAFH
jgi:hypothetical protein